jgi:XrtJ-associated TM-motif-TM protein
MKKTLLFTALAVAMIVAIPARAQSGCEDTPENPTLILAGLASGVYGANQLRMRLRARRAAKNL